jgi:hypothetical protein
MVSDARGKPRRSGKPGASTAGAAQTSLWLASGGVVEDTGLVMRTTLIDIRYYRFSMNYKMSQAEECNILG